jgi:hypothetical protein
MTTRKKGERLTVVYETQHIILKSEQNEPYPKTGWIRFCGKIVVKHNNKQNRVLSKVQIPAPYYIGNVCAAHRPGDYDHFLAVSLWMFSNGGGIAYPTGASEFTPLFIWGWCSSIFDILCSIISIIVCPFIYFCFQLRLLVTPMISPNFSY